MPHISAAYQRNPKQMLALFVAITRLQNFEAFDAPIHVFNTSAVF